MTLVPSVPSRCLYSPGGLKQSTFTLGALKMVKIRPAWLLAGPPLEDGARYDDYKVYLGNLKRGVGRNCIEGALEWVGIDCCAVEKYHFLDSGTAVFVVFWTEYDAAECIRLIRGAHSPLCNPVGCCVSAHRGEIQAFKRSGLQYFRALVQYAFVVALLVYICFYDSQLLSLRKLWNLFKNSLLAFHS